MHIPDGFLSAPVFAGSWGVSLGTLIYFTKRIAKKISDKTVPLLGVMSAFVFAAQMLNFPVMGGTSGHLIGGTLAAVVLGPMCGAISVSIVLIVQCFIFQDGGITALGANIFNMSLLGSFVSYYIYRGILKIVGKDKFVAAVAIASWSSVMLAATACSFELVFSNTVPLKIVLPSMLFVHMFIGIGEAIITSFVVAFLLKVRPDLIYANLSGKNLNMEGVKI